MPTSLHKKKMGWRQWALILIFCVDVPLELSTCVHLSLIPALCGRHKWMAPNFLYIDCSVWVIEDVFLLQKNSCMDELLEWTHIQGPSPDMTHVVSLLLLILIHSDHFYSASSSPLLLRGAPNTARILCRNFTPNWVKDLPKFPTRRLERESNPWPFGRKASTQPMRHTRPM